MTKKTLALATVVVAILACGAPDAFAGVALTAPSTVPVSHPTSFSISAADTASVAFSVDGKTQWTERPKGRKFRRAGAVELGLGRHVLEVRASNPRGHVSASRHTVRVTSAPSSSSPSSSSPSPSSSSSKSSVPASGVSNSTKTGSSTVTTKPVPTTPTIPVPPITPPTEPTPPVAPVEESASSLLVNSSTINSFYLNQSAPGAVSEIADPAGGGESVYQMTVKDSDVYPITPTENPRAELVSKPIFNSGSEFWASSKFYLPTESFPASVPGWLTLMEGPYGEPFSEVPPWHIEVNGTSIQWQRNGTYNWDIPWKMPLVRGSWVSVMLHERFASNGWIEMWINGQPITFFAPGSYNPNHVAPTTKLLMETMDSSTNQGPSAIHLMNYREKGMFPSVTVDEGHLKVGTTRAAVEG